MTEKKRKYKSERMVEEGNDDPIKMFEKVGTPHK